MVGGKERLIVETDGGQRITLNDGPATVLIEDSSGNSIKLENGTVTVRPLTEARSAEFEPGDRRKLSNRELRHGAMQWRSEGRYGHD